MGFSSIFKNTGVGCHSLLQGIFSTQRLNLRLLHWQVDSTTEPAGKPLIIRLRTKGKCAFTKVCIHHALQETLAGARGTETNVTTLPQPFPTAQHGPITHAVTQAWKIFPVTSPSFSLIPCPLHQQVWWFPQTERFTITFSWVSFKVYIISHPFTTLS